MLLQTNCLVKTFHHLLIFTQKLGIILLLLFSGSKLAIALPLGLFTDNKTGSFNIKESTTSNGEAFLKINLKGQQAPYSWLAPMDDDRSPSCSVLSEIAVEEIKKANLASELDIVTECTKSPSADTQVNFGLIKQNHWSVYSLTWQAGWLTLQVQCKNHKPIDHKMAKKLLGIQNRLLEVSSQLGHQWPGLGLSQRSLPEASLMLAEGSKHTAAGGLVSAWHIYEIITHIAETWEGVTNRDIFAISSNSLALALHILDGLSHLHQTFLGNYIYLNFYGDILKASGHPLLTHTGCASTSLLLNFVELYREYGNSHGQGTGFLSFIARYHNEISTLHHTYELWEAINDWANGEDSHSH